ncbi:hypothetical protein BKA69DRAFT_1126033 [Paraphysoderma sedebokerense]|nr:hypothetical protein BKA69DRAFT_1126033 [Paraphysoderma sedebokerense]
MNYKDPPKSKPFCHKRYETFKTVRVRDRRLGLLHYLFSIFIVLYIVISIIQGQLYLRREPVTAGSIRTNLARPVNTSTPKYCNQTTPCVYWPPELVTSPAQEDGAVFLTTRVTITYNSAPHFTGCSPIVSPSADCALKFNKSESVTYHVANIEDYTLMIEHTVKGKNVKKSVVNSDMKGELVFSSWKPSKKFSPSYSGESPRPADVPGDIISVGDILDAADINLDSISSAPGAGPNESLRSSGIVLIMFIDYSNSESNYTELTYKYLPGSIQKAEGKIVEVIYDVSLGNYVQLNRHGVRIKFIQTGTIGEFDFMALLSYLAGAIALFKVAQLIVEQLMLRFLPQKEFYAKYKYTVTEDFSDLRDKLKLSEEEIPERVVIDTLNARIQNLEMIQRSNGRM